MSVAFVSVFFFFFVLLKIEKCFIYRVYTMAKGRGNLMELNRRLISLVQSEPLLWDPTVYGYSTVADRGNGWTKISSILGIPSKKFFFYNLEILFFFMLQKYVIIFLEASCQSKWKTFKTSFRKALADEKIFLQSNSKSKKSKTVFQAKKCPYFAEMQFAREAIEASDSCGNLDVSETEDLVDTENTETSIALKISKKEEKEPQTNHPVQNVSDPVESSQEDLNFFRTLLPYTCKICDEKSLSFRTTMINLVEKYVFENGNNQDIISKFRRRNSDLQDLDTNPDLAFFRTLIDFTTRIKGSKKLRMRIDMTEVVLKYATLDIKNEQDEYSSDDGEYV